MTKSLLLMSALIAAAPALAQTNNAPVTPDSVQPSTSAQVTPTPPSEMAPAPAQGTSGSSATVTTTPPASQSAAQSAPGTTAAATTANPADAVATVVASDWAKYDADSNQNLSKVEFGKWMIALREQNAAAQKDQVKDVNAWATAAFTQADKDKSGSVTKPELEGFLKG